MKTTRRPDPLREWNRLGCGRFQDGAALRKVAPFVYLTLPAQT